MVTQVQPQKETQERHKKTKFIIIGLEYSRVTSCPTGSQGKGQVLVRWQKTGAKGKLTLEPFWSFHGEGKAGQNKQSRVG